MHASRIGISLAVIVAAASGLSARPHPLRTSDAGWPGEYESAQQFDSVATIVRMRTAADSFVRIWRYAWEVSDRYRDLAVVTGATNLLTRTVPANGLVASEAWPAPPGIDTIVLTAAESAAVILSTRGAIAPSELPRRGLLHCHPDVDRNSIFERYDELIIAAGVGKRAICPSWYAKDKTLPWDESKGIDNALVLPLVQRIRDMRASLLLLLDGGARALPGDPWIAGQRVRFALDQGDTARALKVVSECRAGKWWCTALSGYLSHVRGRIAEADSTFLAMLPLIPEPQRCGWTDYGVLLDDDDVKQYYKMSCAGRDSLAERLWWLADPEYGDNTNERRATHFARRVMYELRAATWYHERWEMRVGDIGPAMFEMLVRYGWPNVSIWGGMAEDRNHYGYLNIEYPHIWDHGRFATAEYSQPRAHTVPTLRAIIDPMKSGDYDWILSDSAYKVISRSMRMWWPIEHFERATGPMVQLWSQQGLFRRQDSVMLALATALPPEDFGGREDTLRGTMFLATAPAIQRTIPRSAVIGQTNLIKTFVGSMPQLLSLELHGKETGILGRTRFGVEPPQSLAVLSPREIASSAPVFVRPPAPREVETDNPDAAMARMHSTTWFENISSVGLYWETYGFAATDTAALTVRFIRYEPPARGFLQRFLRGFREAKADISVEWEERAARPAMIIRSGPVPIVGRVVTVDVSELEPGDYSVIVTASRPGGAAVTGESMIHVLSTRRRQ